MNRIRKGQIQGVNKGDSLSQAKFITELFGVAISTQESSENFITPPCPPKFFATQPPLPTPDEVSGLDSHPCLPLSVAQVCLLLRVVLPQPVLDLPAALALIAYQQRHNYAAYRSHRKRLLAQLQGLRW